MTSYIVKENHIGSAVSKIFLSVQTERHPIIFIKDKKRVISYGGKDRKIA